MLTNLVRELDDHDLSVLHTRNTQNGLVGVACVNPLHKKISRPAQQRSHGTVRRRHVSDGVHTFQMMLISNEDCRKYVHVCCLNL